MNTIIIEHADKKTTSLLKQMAEALNLHLTIKKEEEIKYNPELLRRIENFEKGKAAIIEVSLDDLKSLVE